MIQTYYLGKPKGICWSHQAMSNWYKFVLNNPVPATTLMSTQCFFHVGATWGVLEALGKGNIWNHVSDAFHCYHC